MKTALNYILNVILGILIVIGLLLAFSLLPIKGNFKVMNVMSGSMEPQIKVGSSIVVKPSKEYRVGDVISFNPPNVKSDKESITHRIVRINGKPWSEIYYTKGDANSNEDSKAVYGDQIIGKVIFSVPYLGYLLVYIKTLPGLLLIIIIPATIIIYEEIKKIKKEAKTIIKNRKNKKGEGSKGDSDSKKNNK